MVLFAVLKPSWRLVVRVLRCSSLVFDQGAGWELVKQFWRCLLGAAVRALLWVLVGVPVLVLPVLVKMLVRVLVRLLFGVLREGRCLFGDPGQAVLLCAGEEAIWCGEVLWWLRVPKGGA